MKRHLSKRHGSLMIRDLLSAANFFDPSDDSVATFGMRMAPLQSLYIDEHSLPRYMSAWDAHTCSHFRYPFHAHVHTASQVLFPLYRESLWYSLLCIELVIVQHSRLFSTSHYRVLHYPPFVEFAWIECLAWMARCLAENPSGSQGCLFPPCPRNRSARA